jgi:hypothetical protein
MSAEAERSGKEQGEALLSPGTDGALHPRLEREDTGPGLLGVALARPKAKPRRVMTSHAHIIADL